MIINKNNKALNKKHKLLTSINEVTVVWDYYTKY